MSLGYNLYGLKLVASAIKARRPDFIYERYSLNTYCGVLASLFFKIPLVLEVNAPLYLEQRNLGKLTFRRVAEFSERWICSHATWVVVVSAAMKELLIHEGIPSEKIVVIPNGIDPEKFHPGVDGHSIRRKYNLEGRTVIGFVGWFRRWHGLEMLLRVLYETELYKKGVRLLLVGDGPAYRELYHYAREHGLLSAVVFTGSVERQEIAAHIAAMDIAVQPRATEYACPMKLFEYMAMRRCIVAPDQPNIREILQDGVNGYLFRPDDPDDLGGVLLRLIRNPHERYAVARNAQLTVDERRYVWQENARKILELVFGLNERSSVA